MFRIYLKSSPDDVELVDGMVGVKGSPEHRIPLWDVAVVANPIRYAYGEQAEEAMALRKPSKGPALDEGTAPGLEAREYFAPDRATWASGVHVAIIEIDVATGVPEIKRYVAVHDCGRVINPTVVEGQVHGGVAQGIGGSFYERMVYDEDGQPLSSTFMDYLIPTSMEIPDIETVHVETPSTLNPLGIKGAGEAGVIPVAALMASAIEDALLPLGVRVRSMPLSPSDIRGLIRGSGESLNHRDTEGTEKHGGSMRERRQTRATAGKGEPGESQATTARETALNRISEQVIGGAIEVHRALGPGLLESVYHECLAIEMSDRDWPASARHAFPLFTRAELSPRT